MTLVSICLILIISDIACLPTKVVPVANITDTTSTSVPVATEPTIASVEAKESIVAPTAKSLSQSAYTMWLEVEIVTEAPKQRRQCDPVGKKLKSFQKVKYYEMEEQSMLYGVPTFEKYQVCVVNIDDASDAVNLTTATFFCWRCNVEIENGKILARPFDWFNEFSGTLLLSTAALFVACWFMLVGYVQRNKRHRDTTNPDLQEYTISAPGKSWQEKELLVA